MKFNGKEESGTKFDFNQVMEDFRRINDDPGTWPLVPKVVVLLGVFAAVIVAGWLFLWSGQLSDLSNAEEKEEKLKSEFITKKKQAVNLDVYTQQLEEMDRSFGVLLKQLPNRSEVESLLVEINQAGLGRGMQFELFKPGKEEVKDFYAELPISVKVLGTYHDFGAFAADIAKLPRIVTLNDLAISSPKGNGSGELAMEMNIKTFRYLDDAELAVTAKQKEDAKKKTDPKKKTEAKKK